MATVTKGNTASIVVGSDQTVSLSNNHNDSGRWWFVPTVTGDAAQGGVGETIGPLASATTVGPFHVPGTFWITCEQGTSLTYTANASVLATVSITGGSINAATIGGTTAASGRFTSVSMAGASDQSGTPGNVTINAGAGKAAFAAAANTITITNSGVTAASFVFVQLEQADTTLTSIASVVPAAGSFTVTGNAAATAATKFSFVVFG